MIRHDRDRDIPLGFDDFTFRDSTLNIPYGFKVRPSYFYETYVATTKGLEMKLVKIFTDYTYIDFSSNKFEGEIPNIIGELKEVRILNLSHNALSGTIPASLGRLENLESLDLSRNILSGRIPSELASLTFLEYGDFSYNLLVGKIPTSTQLQSFTSSYFEGNLKLCGPPLKTKCSQPMEEGDYDDSKPRSGFEWSWFKC
ncbi:receptor-like protein 48 [Rutidosis leptorrhynchoides]|uniref:receptor-like protein 48 n=1 Tax=Rutidosis leptorrhynchoides TaxID=125765 RepID=UPI003A9A03AC